MKPTPIPVDPVFGIPIKSHPTSFNDIMGQTFGIIWGFIVFPFSLFPWYFVISVFVLVIAAIYFWIWWTFYRYL